MSGDGTGDARVLVSDGPGETRWALLLDETVVEVVHQWDHAPETGTILAGRLGARAPGGRAVFVALPAGPAGFLPLSDLPAPHPPEGTLLAVQVVQEAQGAKGPKLTGKVSLPGHLLVYTPFAPGLGLSPKLGSSAQRKALRARVEPLLEPGEGAIGRTALGDQSIRDSALRAELTRSRALWSAISQALAQANAPVLLHPAPAPIDGWMGSESDAPREILCDSGERARLLTEHMATRHPDWGGTVSVDRQTPPLFDRLGVEEALDEALSPRLSLPGGGALIIEETEALTAIDLDSGGADPIAATRAALPLLAHQIRLRALAGQILVDLPRRGGGPDREAVALLSELLAQDPLVPRLLGVTRGGLVEIVRPRRRPPLSHRLLARRTAPDLAAEARLLGLLRDHLRAPDPKPPLIVSPTEEALLRGPLAAALAEAERRLGMPISLSRP